MSIIWKWVLGYEGLYEVNNYGEVFSHISNKILSTKPSPTTGYHSVMLFKNKIGKIFTNHRLVAQAFIPNPKDKPCVNHKDNNRENNSVSNLEWCTYSENTLHGYSFGNVKAPKAKLSELQIIEIYKSSISVLALCKKYDVTAKSIYNIKNKKTWKRIIMNF